MASQSGEAAKYAYENLLPMGEQINFVVRTQSEQGNYEKILSSSAYPRRCGRDVLALPPSPHR